MNGQSHWIDIVLLLIGGCGVAVLFLLNWLSSRFLHAETRDFVCPRKGSVEAVLVQNMRSGQWLGVRRCTAFKDPDFVTCTRDCVDELNEAEGAKQSIPEVLVPASANR